MAKLYTRLQNEKGKIVGLAANEYIKIQMITGNSITRTIVYPNGIDLDPCPNCGSKMVHTHE